MGWALSQEERALADQRRRAVLDDAAKKISDDRMRLAGKIVMVVVDKIVNEIIRPGPVAEERECYDMAGELRSIVPALEELAKSVIDVNEGVE